MCVTMLSISSSAAFKIQHYQPTQWHQLEFAMSDRTMPNGTLYKENEQQNVPFKRNSSPV